MMNDTQDSSSGANRISLSLSDLVPIANIERESYPVVRDRTAVDYKKEMGKILTRSRGTPYEATLKRFVENKIKELSAEYSDQPVQSSAAYGSLASLSMSKYDSHTRESPFDNTPLFKTKKDAWLETIAQPLPRNVWRESTEKRLSTNSVGRQRPAPEQSVDVAALAASSSFSFRAGASNWASCTTESEFAEWHRSNQEWQQNVARKTQMSRERNGMHIKEESKPQISMRSVKLAKSAARKIAASMIATAATLTSSSSTQPQTTHVSTPSSPLALQGSRDENDPLMLNATLHDAKPSDGVILDNSLPDGDNPADVAATTEGSNTKTIDLGEYYITKEEKNVVGQERGNRPSSISATVGATIGGQDSASLHEHSTEPMPQSMVAPAALNINLEEIAGTMSVYDRLAWHSNSYIEAKRKWKPPGKEDTFAPVICDHSRRLAVLVRSKQEKTMRQQQEQKQTTSTNMGTIVATEAIQSRRASPARQQMSSDVERSSRSMSPAVTRYSKSPNSKDAVHHSLYLHGSGLSKTATSAVQDNKNIVISTSPWMQHTENSSRRHSSAGPPKQHGKSSKTATIRLSDLVKDDNGGGYECTVKSNGTCGSGGIAATGMELRGRRREKVSQLAFTQQRDVSQMKDDDDEEEDNHSIASTDSQCRRKSFTSAELRAHAMANVEKIRSASVERARHKEEERRRQMYRTSEAEDAKPFHPTLAAAKASHRIMKKISNTSFQERNTKFEETLLIREVVNQRGGSPGPGYYSNLLNAPVSPTKSSFSVPDRVLQARAGATTASCDGKQMARERARSQSPLPGHRGYAFGKEELNREGRPKNPFSPRKSKMLGNPVDLGSSLIFGRQQCHPQNKRSSSSDNKRLLAASVEL